MAGGGPGAARPFVVPSGRRGRTRGATGECRSLVATLPGMTGRCTPRDGGALTEWGGSGRSAALGPVGTREGRGSMSTRTSLPYSTRYV